MVRLGKTWRRHRAPKGELPVEPGGDSRPEIGVCRSGVSSSRSGRKQYGCYRRIIRFFLNSARFYTRILFALDSIIDSVVVFVYFPFVAFRLFARFYSLTIILFFVAVRVRSILGTFRG